MATWERDMGKKIEINESKSKDHKVASITIYPDSKAFASSQQSADADINAYRNCSVAAPANSEVAHRQAKLLGQIGDLECRISEEREKGREQGFWWDHVDVGKFEGVEQLKELRQDLEALRTNILARADEMRRANLESNKDL